VVAVSESEAGRKWTAQETVEVVKRTEKDRDGEGEEFINER